MKKICAVIIAVCLLFGVSNVSAMSKANLKKKLTQTITINGVKVSVDNDTKAAIERYLDQFNVSSTDADYIAARVDKAIEILKGEGQTDFTKLSATAKSKLKALVEEISTNTSVHATVTNGSVVVYNPNDGSEFFEATKLVKHTGLGTSPLAIIAGLSVIVVAAGTCLVIKQLKTSE